MCQPTQFFAGFISGGAEGGRYYADASQVQIGWAPADATNGNFLHFESGRTYHVGKWANYVTASSNDGIFTGKAGWNFGSSGSTAVALTYGPTMDSLMTPITTFRYPNTAIRYGQVTANSTTGFTYEVNASGPNPTNSADVHFWCFRI